MRKLLSTLLLLSLFLTMLTAADLSGVWTLDFEKDFGGNPASEDCTFKQDGRVLTVRCGSGAPGTGDVNGQKVVFKMPTGPHDEFTATFTADLDKTERAMKGAWHLVAKDVVDGEFTAKKR